MLSVAGHALLTASVIDVSGMVLAHESEIRSTVGDSTALVFRIGSSPLPAHADARLLQIAIANLVENALEATQAPDRRILVAVQEVWIADTVVGQWSDEIAPGTYVAIRVTDNGEGMDRPRSERVFDPFFSARFLGRGLGLSAVAGIARQHGGAVAVESELGSGTTVTIYIPSAREKQMHE
jgi:signal transduction histidine kinase